MRFLIFIFSLVLITACGGGEGEIHPIRDANHDIDVCVFLWNGERYIDTPSSLAKSLKDNGINCLLFSSNIIDFYLSPEGREKLLYFINTLASRGIKFEFLLSRNDWIYPNRRKELIRILNHYREFSTFYGMNLPMNVDIEPHTIEGQSDFIDPPIERLYLETLSEIKNTIGNFNPVISYVYRYYGVDKKVLEYTDTLVVMLYITDLDRIRENLVYYRELVKGKGLRIAFSVEDRIIGGESFYHAGKEALKSAIEISDTNGADSVVIQDYVWLMELL